MKAAQQISDPDTLTRLDIFRPAYQVQVRLTNVQALLRRGVPLRDIEAGFSDQPHPSRTFKRFLGVTPAQYAAAAQTP